jgi:hypothetical protein
MKKYRITILVKSIEEYEVEAESEVHAEELWPEGKLIRVDDNIDNDIWSVRESPDLRIINERIHQKEVSNTIANDDAEKPPIELPPDPERKNDARSRWAAKAIAAFIAETATDLEDSLGDLLADLMHWCDRNNFDFDAALDRGHYHYAAETSMEGI